MPSPLVSPPQVESSSTRKSVVVFVGLTVILAAMAALGIPPFFPNGTGPIDGLGRLANILLFPFYVAPVGGLVTSYAIWARPSVTLGTKVMLWVLALANLSIGALVVWGLINTTASSSTQFRLATIWVFAGVAVVAFGVGVAALVKPRE